MSAVQLTGHGGFEKLDYRLDVAVPTPAPGEVLINVRAAGVNNTDINTRIGWYSKQVTTDTNTGGSGGFSEAGDNDATWSGEALQFPRIQGADSCGVIVAVGEGVDPARLGERVIVRTMQTHPTKTDGFSCITYGSERDGGFAQFTSAPSSEAYSVSCDWTDVELASIPCAYSTAEGMLHRAQPKTGETVLITGASGGVGSAAIQLAKRRGCQVIAIASHSKCNAVAAIGADRVIPREEDLVAALGSDSVDVVVDLVAGPGWPALLEVLKRGGRYAVSGAIAGPIVELDVRTLYLKDLSFFGCTYQPPEVFANLVSYIEAGELEPLVAHSYPLAEIVTAQQTFLEKGFIGKLVLVPDEVQGL